jgi:O-Antigen ligase
MTTSHSINPYSHSHDDDEQESHEHYEYHDHHDFEPEDIHSTPWKLYAFLLIPFLEVISPIFMTTEQKNGDTVKAIVVGGACAVVMLFAFFDLIYQARKRASDHSTSMRILFQTSTWLGGIGVFALALAAGWRNEVYYVGADIYHWFVEFLLVSFLGVWACSSYSSLTISRAFTNTFLALGCMGLAIVVLGISGFAVGGGHAVEGFAMWRIELGRAFPMVPMILVVACFLFAPWHHHRLPMKTLVTVGILGICLIFTWKRTQWAMTLCCLASLVMLMLPKKAISLAPLFFMLFGACLWAFHITSPRTIPHLIADLKEMVTYNENWTIDQTMDTREAQVTETFRIAAREPFGHGFGAEIQILRPDGKSVEKLHYVHSLYAYYALQFGVPGCLVATGVLGVLMLSLYRAVGMNEEAQWLVKSALVCWVALAGSGLMLVSIHTVFSGVVLALSVVGLARCLQPHSADGYNDDHAENYDDHWHDSMNDESYEHVHHETDEPHETEDEHEPESQPVVKGV